MDKSAVDSHYFLNQTGLSSINPGEGPMFNTFSLSDVTGGHVKTYI